MDYIELKSSEVIKYFKNKKIVGKGYYGILYEYDINTLIKLYYKEYYQSYISKKVISFNKDILYNIKKMYLNCDFNRDNRIIELSGRLSNTSSNNLIKAIVTNKKYRIGILEEYYKEYENLDSIIYDLPLEKRKYVIDKIKDIISELFFYGIYPLDIKEDNFLINDNLDVKIIDLDGEDVSLGDKNYILAHPYIEKMQQNKIIEMEYRLLRH